MLKGEILFGLVSSIEILIVNLIINELATTKKLKKFYHYLIITIHTAIVFLIAVFVIPKDVPVYLSILIAWTYLIPFFFIYKERIVGKKAAKIGITVITIIRVFPEVILALIILKAIGMNPLTCVIAIGIHSIGMLGRMFSESIDNMDYSPIEALDAVGANTWQKIRFGILPQVIPELASTTLYRFDINIRSASVLGVIGTLAGGFGALLLLAGSDPNNQWDTIAALLVVIVIMVLIVDSVSAYLRKKLV